MRLKLAGKFDETLRRERAARLVGRMIAPDAQRHPVACIRQRELAIRLEFPGRFRLRGLDLHVHPRFHFAVLCGAADFAERHQIHVCDQAGRLIPIVHGQFCEPPHLTEKIYGLATPITPQATRPPALPVGCVFKSSTFS